jgi:DNA (cytosine-5)-methyltransferase 1
MNWCGQYPAYFRREPSILNGIPKTSIDEDAGDQWPLGFCRSSRSLALDKAQVSIYNAFMTISAPSSLSILDLFSGIGGFSYAAEQLVGGFHTVAFCDTDKACHKVLAKHWPSTPIFPDIRELTAADIQPLCPNGLSLITAGFPCQDLSVAGKQAGYDGERSVLFYEIIRLARELRPDFLLLENVRNLLSHQNGETFQETLFQIAKAGYDAEWAVIPASDVGACHKRERIWIVAYANHRDGESRSLSRSVVHEQADGQGADGHTGGANEIERNGTPTHTSSRRNIGFEEHTRKSFQLECMGEAGALDAAYANSGRQQEQGIFLPKNERSSDGMESIFMRSSGSGKSTDHSPQWSSGTANSQCARLSPEWTSYASSPVLCRGDDGLSHRVDRLKQLGNSIVPQVAAIPLQRIKHLAQFTS